MSHEAPPPAEPVKKAPDHRAAALIGVLTLLLGFAIAVQLRATSSQDALSNARPDDLISILDDQNSRATRLRSQIASEQSLLQRLDEAGGSDAAAAQEAQRQVDTLGILNGTLPAIGTGVVVTITDPKRALKAEDLLDVIEELRGAGAEAIQFDQVRVGLTSAFTDAADAVILDGQSLSAPNVVRAIGPAKTMDTALNIPGGVSAVVRTAGGTAQVVQEQSVQITVLRTLKADRYAVPTTR
jgi:uncharacterized protein YlxW (UPF0749 family)